MSKYIKLEDAINAIEDKIAEYIPTLYGRYAEIPLELRMAIEHLPTIEVSEDCISREWVKGICENILDEEMLGHMLGYIEDAPSVVVRNNRTTAEPQTYITEDRDTQILDAWQVHHRNAPSVLPSCQKNRQVGRAEGEWIGTEYDGYADGNPVYYEWICSECKCVVEDEEPTWNFCPNCGAKMKGAEDDN